MCSTRRAWSAALVTLVLIAEPFAGAESRQKAFESSWVGQHVVVRQSLYSLVFKERGLRGSMKARRDGLTVVTPFAGRYFQFDGRQRVDDVADRDVQKIPGAVKAAYVKDQMLGEGSVQAIDPVMLARYEPGTELVVRAARVSLDSVRLELSLATDGDTELATSLRVQWPAPLSKSFSERVDIDDLIQQFLTIAE